MTRWKKEQERSQAEMQRLTEYHAGKAVIKNKTLFPEAMRKLARLEDLEDTGKLGVPQAGSCESCLMQGDFGDCSIYGYGRGTREACRKDCGEL